MSEITIEITLKWSDLGAYLIVLVDTRWAAQMQVRSLLVQDGEVSTSSTVDFDRCRPRHVQ